jgi:integrase
MRKSQSANKSPHVDSRGRDYLRPDEANALIEAAGKAGRQPFRDQCLLRLIYRHGLRASEARDARWTDFAGISLVSGLGNNIQGQSGQRRVLGKEEDGGNRQQCLVVREVLLDGLRHWHQRRHHRKQ